MKKYMIAFDNSEKKDSFLRQQRQFVNFREAAHYAFRTRLELGQVWNIRYIVESK
jgi:hypothetical protein